MVTCALNTRKNIKHGGRRNETKVSEAIERCQKKGLESAKKLKKVFLNANNIFIQILDEFMEKKMQEQNRKPFNLEQALAGKPVVTRDGREVQDLHYFKAAIFIPHKLVYMVQGNLYTADEKGINSVHGSEINDNELDLFMKSEKKTYWLWVEKDISREKRQPLYHETSNLYLSEIDAHKSTYKPERYKLIPVELDL